MFKFLKKNRAIKPEASETGSFILCSSESIGYALSNIDELDNYNNTNNNHFKSYSALVCPKDNLIRSFYFLRDVIQFCEKEPIYQNKELDHSLRSMYYLVNTYFLDVPLEIIPLNKSENYEFGRQFKLSENLASKELQDLTLAYWRNQEQWKFWAANYGDNVLGKYCERMSKNRLI